MQSSFAIGDKAVYPVHGVAEVVALEKRDIAGSATSVYVLKILGSGVKIMVPTANADTVGLRSVMSRKEANQVYSVLRTERATRDSQTWNRRYRRYMDKIKTGNVLEIAEVLRDLSTLRNRKELSFGERRMLDTARDLLVKELALAKDATEEQVEEEIDLIFTQAA